MPRPADDEKFLRAAIKTGLRLLDKESRRSAENGDGVATLQRIKASLRNRKKTSTSTS